MKNYRIVKNPYFLKTTQILVLLHIFIFSLTISSCSSDSNVARQADNKPMVTFQDSLSYAIGINVGVNLPDTDISNELLIEGLKDFWSTETPRLTPEERNEILRTFNVILATEDRKQVQKMNAESRELSRLNKIDGQAFLDKNKIRDGVRVLQRSGIQYKAIKTGSESIPDYDDTVVIHYNGYLINGDLFDSSYNRGEPITLKIDQFISGWQLILKVMPVGSKWEVVIPFHLAYGEAGLAKDFKKGEYIIPPAATLVFEMELLEIIDL